MCKQHFNTLPVAARLLKCLGLGQRPGNVTSFLVNATRYPAGRRLWTALRLEQTATTIVRACEIKKCLPIVDQLASRQKCLARRTGIDVAFLVEREVLPAKGPIVALRLVDHLDVRCDI